MRIRILTVILAVVSLSLPASADVIYTFSASAFGASGTYSFLEPSILTTATTIPASAMFNVTQTGGVLTSFFIDPVTGSTPSQCISLSSPCAAVDWTQGAATIIAAQGYAVPLTSLGTYTGNPTITIANTPEPSAFALLGTGLLGIASFIRRRRSS